MMYLNELRNILQSTEIKIISVDVFDTLLLRDTKPEQLRFKEISELQANALNEVASIALTPEDFYLSRRDAARTVYATKTSQRGGREANWPEIFRLIFRTLGIPPREEFLSKCADIELAYERNRLSLNQPLCALLKVALGSGKQVACVSDMYLSGSQIGQLIQSVAESDPGFKVYSSADYGYGKGSGALFNEISNDFAVDLPEIFHCGDNWHADFQKPKSLGLRAMYLPRSTTWKLARKARSWWFDRTWPTL